MTLNIHGYAMLTIGLWGVLSLSGCRATPAQKADIQSRDPYSRVSGIQQAVSEGRMTGDRATDRRRTAIPKLVGRLEDEEVVVRFSAILALEKITGTRLGYDYWSSQQDRSEAVHRWRHRVREEAKERLDRPPEKAGAR